MEGDTPNISGAAQSVVHSLRDQPILLVIVLLNALMIGTLIWGVVNVATARTEVMNRLIERCAPIDLKR